MSDTNEVFRIGVDGGSTTFFRKPDVEAGYVYFYSVSNSIAIDDVDTADEDAPQKGRPSTSHRKGAVSDSSCGPFQHRCGDLAQRPRLSTEALSCWG